MFINLRKVKILLRKTLFLYIILILLGLNSYLEVTFATQTPSNQAYFESTPSFSLAIESPVLPELWSRQIPAPTPIPEPDPTPTPFVTPSNRPTPTLTPTPSPTANLTQETELLFSILDGNEELMDEISWGALVPGGEYNKTLILRNEGIDPLNVTMKVENWQPLEAKFYMITSLYQNLSKVDLQGVQIESAEKVELMLFLKISHLIEGIDEFNMEFVFTANNLEVDDMVLDIKIVSNS